MQVELDVFVSSSMSEFPEERAMLRSLIPTLSQGVVTLRAWVYEDDAYASEDTIQSLYRRHLHNAELYIGIFGKSYGKYTIDEFNQATEWGIPRHIYVRTLAAGEKRDPALEDFLKKISDVEYGLAPRWFHDPDDLERGVRESLAHWLANRLTHRSGTISATLATSRGMLEDLPKKLIGREELIAEIDPLLDQGETVLLQGFGGMGKSALAATVADRRINGRPVLWQKLGSESADVVFEAIARPFNAQQTVAAAKDEEKRQIIRQLLLNANVSLVVLDDAWDGMALNSVLKAIPKNIPVLITSRHRYSIRKVIRVGELSPERALEVLGYYADQDFEGDANAVILCQILGHHAFALEVAGRTMQSADLTPNELMRRIADNPTNLEVPEDFVEDGRRTVADLLNASLTMLDNETQRLFLAMGAFFAKQITVEMLALYFADIPPVTPAMIAQAKRQVPDIAEVSDDEIHMVLQHIVAKNVSIDLLYVEQALEKLVLRGLAERERENERSITHYRLHDLAYSYARARNTDTDRRRALQACLAYVERYNEPSPENFRVLRPALDNLLNAASWAIGVGYYAEVERFAWDLYAQGSEILDYDGLYTQAIWLLEQAAEAANKRGKKQNQGAHFTHLGLCYGNLGQYQKAIGFYEQALAIDRQLEDRRGEQADLGNLGLAYRNLGQVDKAIEHHEQALAIAREVGDRSGQGKQLGNLGIAYSHLRQIDKAIDYYEQALAIQVEMRDRRGQSNQLGNLGNAYATLGQVETAIDYHMRALAISREIGDRHGAGNDLGNLGNAYFRLGEYATAIQYYQQALAVTREIGDRPGEGNNLNNMGMLHEDQGDNLMQAGSVIEARSKYQAALGFYQQSYAIRVETGAQHLLQSLDRSIARVRAKLSDSG